MYEQLYEIINWLVPPFFVYLIHPIFMGLVIPSRLRKWWQIVLLAAFVSLFNLPKAVWGIYSIQANIFRLISLPVLQIIVPLFFFKGPVWKRLITNLLMFSGQIVGEGVAVWTVTSPANVRIESVVTQSFGDAMIYAVTALFCNALFDCLMVVFARSLQARSFSKVYFPTIFIVLSLWGMFFAYISDANGLFCCICMILSGGAMIALLHYILSLEDKSALEMELQSARHHMALEQAHYKDVEARQEELTRIRHDFNNQLAVISLLIETGEDRDAQQMIQALGKDIAGTKENPYCAIPVVNAILAEKERLCKEKTLEFSAELDIPKSLAVEPLQLCSIFANLMDNAIHGAETCGQPSAKIELSSAMVGDYLLIKTVNPSLTPQKPSVGHGYGSQILRELAAQYGGSYQTNYENGIYTAVVSFLVQ